MIFLNDKLKSYYNTSRSITAGTYNKFKGMYIGEQNNPACKQNKNILLTMVPTSDLSDTIVIRRGFYQRNYLNHKKGDPKLVKILRKVPSSSTPNIQAAWQMVYDYPTVSYGLCCTRRDVLVIDSDAFYKSIDEAENIITDFTTRARLPKVSYILRNPSSGHIQCGWFLNKPFSKQEFPKYNEMTKTLATIYQKYTNNDGDICFNGPACKNPFYEDFESVVSYEVVDKDSMIKTVENYKNLYIRSFSSSSYSPSYNITNVTATKESVKIYSKAGKKKAATFGSLETSRDAIECKKLREWVWSEMRRGSTPTYQDARRMMNDFAVEAARITKKPVHSSSELDATTKCTYTWAKTHFKKASGHGDSKGAAWGRLVHKQQSFLLYVEVMKYKHEHPAASTREIGGVVGLSAIQVSRFLRADPIEKLYEVNTFLQYVSDYPSYGEQYQDLIEDLLKAKDDLNLYIGSLPLSSYSLPYNITNVTAEDETKEMEEHLQSEEKRRMTWSEYFNSQDIRNTLKRQPTIIDYTKYIKEGKTA